MVASSGMCRYRERFESCKTDSITRDIEVFIYIFLVNINDSHNHLQQLQHNSIYALFSISALGRVTAVLSPPLTCGDRTLDNAGSNPKSRKR